MVKRFAWRKTLGAALVAVALGAKGSEAADAPLKKSTPAEPSAVPKVTGQAAPNALISGLVESAVAQGSTPLENGTQAIPFYGYDGDGPMLPAPGAVQTPGSRRSDQDRARQEHLPRAAVSAARMRPTTTARASSSRATRSARRAASPASTSMPTPRIGSPDRRQGHQRQRARFRRLDLGSVAARLLFTPRRGGRRSLAGDDRLSLGVVGHLGRLRPRRIRGHPERLRRQRLDRRGHRRPERARSTTTRSSRTASSTASSRRKRNDLTQGGKLQALQVMSLATRPADRVPRRQADADILSQDVKDLHTYGQPSPRPG